MTEALLPERRKFLGKLAAGAVALGVSGSVTKAFAGELRSTTDIQPSDKWLTAVTGKHRQIFDLPNHENGWGLLHVRNYLNTLRDTYHATHPDVTAVVTIYGMGTMLAFNDDMWKKYSLGSASKVNDASNAPATANVFYKADPATKALSVSGTPRSRGPPPPPSTNVWTPVRPPPGSASPAASSARSGSAMTRVT